LWFIPPNRKYCEVIHSIWIAQLCVCGGRGKVKLMNIETGH
jgi:hypothetical protein